jgi:hypothetical protein
MYATGFCVDGMDGREEFTIGGFFGPTEVRNMGEICREEEDRARNTGDGHIRNQMLAVINREYDFGRSPALFSLFARALSKLGYQQSDFRQCDF